MNSLLQTTGRRRLFSAAFGALCILLCAGCDLREQEATRLYREAEELTKAGVRLEEKSPLTYQAASKALQNYEGALKAVAELESNYSETLLGQGILLDSLQLGPLSLITLRDIRIPRLERLTQAARRVDSVAEEMLHRLPASRDRATLFLKLGEICRKKGDSACVERNLQAALFDFVQLPPDEDSTVLIARLAGLVGDSQEKESDLTRRARDAAAIALSRARLIKDSAARQHVLIQGAFAFLQLSAPSRAVQALRSAPDSKAAIAEVGALLVVKGREELLPVVIGAANGPAERVETTLSIAEKFPKASSQILTDVESSMRAIRSGKSKDAVMIRYALALIEAGMEDAARSALESVAHRVSTVSEDNALLAARIAFAHAKNKDFAASRELLERLRKTIGRPPARKERDPAYFEIARTFAQLAQFDQAHRAAGQIQDPVRKTESLLAVARLALSQGENSAGRASLLLARDALPRISAADLRTEYLSHIRDLYVESGSLTEAKEMTERMRSEGGKWRKFTTAFHQSLLKAELFLEALEVARSIDESSLRALLIADTARARGAAGAINDAASLFEEVDQALTEASQESKRSAAALLAADKLLELNWPKLAEELVKKHAPQSFPSMLPRLIDGYQKANSGQDALAKLEGGLRWAKAIDVPLEQAAYLAELAGAASAYEFEAPSAHSTLLWSIVEPTEPESSAVPSPEA